MREMLIDLYRHQEWADAELWRAFERHPGALRDKALWERLHHIHLVQQAFLAIAQRVEPRFTDCTDYADPCDLKKEAQQYHASVIAFLDGLDGSALERAIRIPWFKDPPLEIATGQALLQAAMHSHYHRGQNATRLRELGGEPPLTDYIVWLWKGKAAAEWP
jgi:uncharacterized damage-inducible protein DinB